MEFNGKTLTAFGKFESAEEGAFWNAYQKNGKRTNYVYGFAGRGWNDESFKPKYNIIPEGNAENMFRLSRIVNLKQCLESCGVRLDFSRVEAITSAFTYCDDLKVLPKLNLSNLGGVAQVFYGCTALETIEEIRFAMDTKFNHTFHKCNSLTHMIVKGTIGQNGLDLHYSTQLDKESILSVIGCLANRSTYTGTTTWAVTLGAENLAKLTDAEKAIATQKGWTLA